MADPSPRHSVFSWLLISPFLVGTLAAAEDAGELVSVNGREGVSWCSPYPVGQPFAEWLSAEGLAAMEQPDAAGILRVEKAPVADCRAVRGFTWHPLDGRIDSRSYAPRQLIAEWPFTRMGGTSVSYGIIYWSRKSMSDGLHVRLADGKGFNAVVVRSREGFKGSLRRDNTRLYPPWDGAELIAFDGSRQYLCRGFDEPIQSRRLSFTNKVNGKTLGDVLFLRVKRAATAKGYERTESFLFPRAGGIPESLGYHFRMHFNEDRRVRLGVAGARPDGREDVPLEKEPSGYIHLLIPPKDADFALGAVRLRLAFSGWQEGERVLVSVQDPLCPASELISYPFPVGDDGAVLGELDFPDQIVPPGRTVWIRVLADGARLRGGSRAPRVELLLPERGHALTEYYQYRFPFFKGVFATLSEPRPHSRAALPPGESDARERLIRENKYGGCVLRNLFESLDELRRLYPDDPIVNQYYEWTHYKEGALLYPKTMAVAPRRQTTDANAPDWAVAVRNNTRELLDIAQWWLDNRRTPNGEFGGSVNDDTCLLQQFYALCLLSDGETADKIRAACRDLYELALEHNLDLGINKLRTDPLHAYEEGINMAATMPLLFYGDALDYERLALTARSVQGLTFAIGDRRYFRKHFFRSQDLETDDKDFQESYHGLLLHPAGTLAWYSRKPAATGFIRAFLCGLAACGKDGQVPMKIDTQRVAPAENTAHVPLLSSAYAQPLLVLATHAPDALGDLDGFLPPEQMARLRGIASPAAGAMPGQYTTDTSLVSLTQRMARDTLLLRRYKYICTKAEIYTDRIFPPQRALHMTTLGETLQRNAWRPGHYVSYAGLGDAVAPLLIGAGDSGLTIALHSFARTERAVSIRVWRLRNGRYTVTGGPDANQDLKADRVETTTELHLHRYAAIPVTVPPGVTWIVHAVQKEALDPIRERADLAVHERRITHDPRTRTLWLSVWNIGSRPSGRFEVALARSGGVIARATVGSIAPAADFMPPSLQVAFRDIPALEEPLDILVDPDDRVPEITEVNNTARVHPGRGKGL